MPRPSNLKQHRLERLATYLKNNINLNTTSRNRETDCFNSAANSQSYCVRVWKRILIGITHMNYTHTKGVSLDLVTKSNSSRTRSQ